MCMKPPDRTITGPSHVYRRRPNCKPENTHTIGDHPAIIFSIKKEKGNIASEENNIQL